MKFLSSSALLSDLSRGRNNNFLLIRMIAAVAVIIDHASILGANQYIRIGGLSLGAVAVNVFFIVSGYLVTKSYLRSRLPGDYVRSRFLRIWPALIVNALFVAFVMGPLINTGTVDGSYFSAAATYVYHVITFDGMSARTLPGVFVGASYADINGSLWTLPYEMICYCVLGLIGLVVARKNDVRVVSILLITLVVLFLADALTFLRFFMCYFIGMSFLFLENRIRIKGIYALVLIALTAACFLWFRASGNIDVIWMRYLYVLLFNTTLGYAVLYVGLVPKKGIVHYNKVGDASYGTYIYGWPVLNTLYMYLDSVWQVTFAALVITISLGFLSWHLVEKHCIVLNGRLRYSYMAHAKSPRTAQDLSLWFVALCVLLYVFIVPILIEPEWYFLKHHQWVP